MRFPASRPPAAAFAGLLNLPHCIVALLCRPFFLFVLQALPAATALPLALRFPQRPELLLAAGTLLRCILHPRAQPAMAALWIVSGSCGC